METLIYELLKEKKTAELISELKKDPAMLTFTDSRGATILMLSFYFRNQELSDYILSARKPIDIYEAVIAGDLVAAKNFLEGNKNLIDAHSRDGFTPIGFAAYFSRPGIVSWLLKAGADLNIPSSNAFKVAPIHSSVSSNNLEITEFLLSNGANPNAKQQNDITPLMGAAHNGNLAIVKLLLKSGADKSLKTGDGKPALDFAKEVKAEDVIALLA